MRMAFSWSSSSTRMSNGSGILESGDGGGEMRKRRGEEDDDGDSCENKGFLSIR